MQGQQNKERKSKLPELSFTRVNKAGPSNMDMLGNKVRPDFGQDGSDDGIMGEGELSMASSDMRVVPSGMEAGEIIQQFSSGKTVNHKMTASAKSRFDDKKISMVDLMDALEEDQNNHVKRRAQAPGLRRYAVPRGRFGRGFVHPDDLLENNNRGNSFNKYGRRNTPRRRLLDSYRPSPTRFQEHKRDKNDDIIMGDSADRGPREDRGYDRGDRGGRGGGSFNRKRRYRGE